MRNLMSDYVCDKLNWNKDAIKDVTQDLVDVLGNWQDEEDEYEDENIISLDGVTLSTRLHLDEASQTTVQKLLKQIRTTSEKDKAVYDVITDLYSASLAWIQQVESIGNQNAHTDRLIETIINIGKALEVGYNKQI